MFSISLLPFGSQLLPSTKPATTHHLQTHASTHKLEPVTSLKPINPKPACTHKPFDDIPHSKKAPYYAKNISFLSHSQNWISVLSAFNRMLHDNARPNTFLIPKLLKACAELSYLLTGSAIHGYIMKVKLRQDLFIGNSLIDMYAKCNNVQAARNVFDRMKERDVVSWTVLLNAYANLAMLDEAVSVFGLMQHSGTQPDMICWNALVSGYAKSGDIVMALELLELMKSNGIEPGVNSWNGVISGCVQNGFFMDALDMLFAMCLSEKPNSITIASVLPACSGLGELLIGKELHAYVIRSGIKMNVYLGGSLIDMYLKCGLREYAERVFLNLERKNLTIWNQMIASYAGDDNVKEALRLVELMKGDGIKPDVVTYNTILASYARRGEKDEAFDLFSKMSQVGLKPNVISMNALISGFHSSGLNQEALKLFQNFQSTICPNAISIASALSICSDLKLLCLGKEIHCYALRKNLDDNVYVVSALVDLYANCGNMTYAAKTFELIKEKNVVSWNVLMSGHNHNGNQENTMILFCEMLEQNQVVPNSVTILIVLQACSNTTALRFGRELHGYIAKCRFDEYSLAIASSLISMYVRCGSVKEARLVFDSMNEKDLGIWNAMISGYSLHGMSKDVIALFKEMEDFGVCCDNITFISILMACDQEGLVEQGFKYFNEMEDVYNVSPTLEHYTCMVSILSTTGLLTESMELIKRMPYEPDACVWATLLKACRLHLNYEIGEKAAKALFELEPDNASNYILLSNIFSKVGMWDSYYNTREDVKSRGLKTIKTCSRIYVNGRIQSFKAGDRSHCDMEKILDTWDDLANKMVASGYVPQNIIFCKEGEVDPFLCYHTERVAVCYGIISSQRKDPIRVSKNVRMCVDCHCSVKFISKIAGREIFVADGCFYHHFKEGMCSCRDRW